MMFSVVDTNILIRALIRPQGTVGPIIVRLENEKFTLVYSKDLIAELDETLHLPRIMRKHDLTDQTITAYIILLKKHGKEVEPTRTVTICRDVDDNKVIEAALEGNAKYVVTGDEDLL
ncbi:MAG: putative toxin-antitoxin system toxin component, PIN family, partial [Chloroflexi bacterium]|nr:putative toxin-antitoxin system toxin component, PIN family [Chloroflexota bacterium]